MSIFLDIVEDNIKVVVDDFLVMGDSFATCLFYVAYVLMRYEDYNLLLKWEIYEFMVK